MSLKIILYIATSLDGFISKKDGNVAFLEGYGNEKEDYGYGTFLSSIDSIILGNTTFRQYGADYGDKPVFVFSREKQEKQEGVTFTNEDPTEFVKKLKGNVWMIGGASIFNEFLKRDLIDEFIITIIPTVLGEGIPLFRGVSLTKLKLVETKSYEDGVVQLHYKLRS